MISSFLNRRKIRRGKIGNLVKSGKPSTELNKIRKEMARWGKGMKKTVLTWKDGSRRMVKKRRKDEKEQRDGGRGGRGKRVEKEGRKKGLVKEGEERERQRR